MKKHKEIWKSCLCSMLMIAMFMTLPGGASAQLNGQDDSQKSTISLSKSVIYLKTGETADVNIQNADLVEDNTQNIGIAFTLDSKVYTEAILEKDSFSEYGISRYWPETDEKENILLTTPDEPEGKFSENGNYYGLVSNQASILEVANGFANVPGVLRVSVVNMAVPGGEMPYENWSVKDTEVANMTVFGGELLNGFSEDGPYLNQTAKVQGLKQGVTKLSVERGGFGAYASAGCTVIVYEPDSMNNPGDINHDGGIGSEDALKVLKHTAGLGSLEESEKQTGDLNLDEKVNAEDALLMLKIVAGII